jgi:hypothetical protein
MKPMTANLLRPIIIQEIGGMKVRVGFRVATAYSTTRKRGMK